MAMSKEKKSKKCRRRSKLLWYGFGAAGLGARGLAALGIITIALMLYPIKHQSKNFNRCVDSVIESGRSISESVYYCNGGT